MDYRQPQMQQEPQLKKAKLKALKLLERMDRTEAQLREKLKAAEFDPEIIEQAIVYVKSFGYIDDERYVRNYIEYRQDRKSRRQLEQELQFRKGVTPELIQKVYDELEPYDERLLIKSQLEKRKYSAKAADWNGRQKIVASLMRKGFQMGDILAVMDEYF